MPISSPFPQIHIHDQPLHELILNGVKEHVASDRPAFINGDTNERYTFRDLSYLTHQISAQLYKYGLCKGDVLVICLPNCPEYAFIFLAAALRGAVTSGVNPLYTSGYGLTESSGVSHAMPPTPIEEVTLGSCGVLLPNYDGKVVDIETGEEVGANRLGEICMKSSTVMLGYLNRPEATACTIDKDGWLHTGDIGYYDEEGLFFVIDRLKELIKVKGFQVPPAELEDLLISNPEIQDAAVIGVEDEISGEIPKAFVVRKGNSKISSDEIQRYIAGKVAPYKQLTGGVEFVKELPKSPSGKILRRFLKNKSQAKPVSKL